MKLIEITGKDLADVIGVDPRQYESFSLPKTSGEQTYLEPKELFTEKRTITIPTVIKRVGDGKWKSGEIWMDTFYEVMYLYIGKTYEGKDLALQLGGDALCRGQLEIGVINSGREDRIFFDKKLFP
jgi:hypothetical protein